MQEITPDTWNEPQPVTIDGQVFMMRELSAISLRTHARDFFAIAGRVTGKKEVLDMLRGTAAEKEAAYAEIYAGTMDGYSDEVFAILSEATGMQSGTIGMMPASMLFGLVDAFLQLHEKSLKRFFGVRRRWEDIVAEWKGQDTAPQNSSHGSSAEASPTASVAN